ncbi:ARM repeat-containing protein [Guyanagaster necrorhizus]|uniref:ARM repeat-containing protein n=1 Tax=Guyanagaster necrorhizus TaxID=856835 RepID=A0A9P8AVR9_9AGAR|nr:ARM repeat-containing protein [Guyanagaster necrorhizus MCA 3950]KAG7449615.1 ARM repeat-containing protein [Guyanagaster necrorhizus MCA 3950]
MDYLRTLGSAAVSTLVQKSGLNLPFSLGPKVTSLDGICTLYEGTKRDDSSPVSVFEYDFSQKKNLEPLAKNALRKLRTTRHPDVLKYLDAAESDSTTYIMTERVRPLQMVLQSWSTKDQQQKEDWLLWGLHRISVALAFLNDSCSSTHGNVRISSVFISPSGEWKLGGLEVLSNPNDDAAVLYTMGGLLPDAMVWAPPEVKKSGWSALKQGNAADAYALGLLVNAVFNPAHHPPATSNPPHPPPTAASRGAIPAAVFPLLKNLLNPNSKARWTSKRFLDTGMVDSGFFMTNRLVRVCGELDNFALGSEAQKASLLRNLNESSSSFPPEFATHRILPSLVSALEFGGASAATILPLVLKFSKNVSPDDYPTLVLIPLVKLFTSPDRGTRMALLDHLPEYVEKLDKKTVDSKIFPHLQTGFSDTVAVIREATVKSIILLAPKLSDRVLNNDLLRHLARMQTDTEPSIRTNTCILIGRLGPTLGYNTKRKVLVPAFTRALKDSFVHARVAGLMAFMATIDCFDIEDLATKVIPNMSPAMLDKEKLVRDQAFKAMEIFVKKLETHAATMPETILSDPGDRVSNSSAPASVETTLVNSAAGAAGALAGWAVSSLGKRLAAADMQSVIGDTGIDRPTSVPVTEDSRIGNLRPGLFVTSMSATNSTVSSPAVATFNQPIRSTSSKSKGLQLSATKSSSAGTAALVDQLAEEVDAEKGHLDSNPWGNDDLIDVNADYDDWSAFETAPTPEVVQPKPVRPSASGLGLSVNGNPYPSHDTKPQTSRSRSPAVKQTNNLSPVHRSNTAASSPADDWNRSPLAIASLTKEERAAEMARRKEERKQRIAMLKEQKKNANKS